MQQTEENINLMKQVVRIRSPLALLVLDDEAVRLRGESTARSYLRNKWACEDNISYWMWALGWTAFGVLLCLSILSSGVTIAEMVKGIWS